MCRCWSTLGKAFGTSGAFVAGSEELIESLIQFAYIALAKSEADRLGVNDGALLSLTLPV